MKNEKMTTKKLTKIFALSLLTLALTTNNSFASLGGSTDGTSSDSQKGFDETEAGVGVTLGYKFKLTEGVFVYDEEATTKDNIYLNPEIFYNNYFGQSIDDNYGAGLNLGYNYKKFNAFVGSGYVVTDFDYEETNTTTSTTTKESFNEDSSYVSIGIGYNITEHIVFKTVGMMYSVDFKPKDSVYDKVDLDVKTINFQIGYDF